MGDRKLYTLALVSLGAGALVYALDRPAEQIYFLSGWFQSDVEYNAGWHDSLPTFFHALAFSPALAATAGSTAEWAVAASCSGWFLSESLLESIQAEPVADALLAALPGFFPSAPVLQALPAYLRHGTFDVGDLVAAVGCLLAYVVATQLRKGRCP